MTLLTKQAHQAFLQGNFHTARNAYRELAGKLGSHLFQANLRLCENREYQAVMGARQYRSAQCNADDPLITYCVPVMNRLDDLKKTLIPNLQTLSQFRSVRLMVNVFDANDEAEWWIQSQCSVEMDEGRLVVNRLPPMGEWHMSIGKNSFKCYLTSGYYSSLDSDNYLSVDEVVKTKQAIKEFGDCLIHHFSGHWGDGSCGHITLPVHLYQSAGYTEAIYPRQFDELSLIANVIGQRPGLPVITRHGVNILQKTRFLREFIELSSVSPSVTPCSLGVTPTPENGKENTYAEEDQLLKCYSELNGYYATYSASQNPRARQVILEKVHGAQYAATRSPAIRELAKKTLKYDKQRLEMLPAPEEVHVMVIERSDSSLTSLLNQKRSQGAKGFVLIDATPNKVLASLCTPRDTLVMTPLVGDEDSFGEFWLHCANVILGKEQHITRLPKTRAGEGKAISVGG